MSGGGDTPVSNTYVAIYDPGSLSVGQFYVGKIEGNTLKYYGSTANDEIIIVDSDGKKVSDAEFYQSLGNTLFQKVKEVYADISNDEIIDYSLAQGETIPDWSEYVQIGDAPTIENGFKYPLYGYYIVGTCKKENSNFLDAYLFKSDATDYDRASMFNAEGRYMGSGAYLETDVQQALLSALESHFGEQVENIYYVPCPVSGGEFLPNWDEYGIIDES